jgi:hypothetical protein
MAKPGQSGQSSTKYRGRKKNPAGNTGVCVVCCKDKGTIRTKKQVWKKYKKIRKENKIPVRAIFSVQTAPGIVDKRKTSCA